MVIFIIRMCACASVLYCTKISSYLPFTPNINHLVGFPLFNSAAFYIPLCHVHSSNKKISIQKKIRANEVLKKIEISILYAYTSPHHKKTLTPNKKSTKKIENDEKPKAISILNNCSLNLYVKLCVLTLTTI